MFRLSAAHNMLPSVLYMYLSVTYSRPIKTDTLDTIIVSIPL